MYCPCALGTTPTPGILTDPVVYDWDLLETVRLTACVPIKPIYSTLNVYRSFPTFEYETSEQNILLYVTLNADAVLAAGNFKSAKLAGALVLPRYLALSLSKPVSERENVSPSSKRIGSAPEVMPKMSVEADVDILCCGESR